MSTAQALGRAAAWAAGAEASLHARRDAALFVSGNEQLTLLAPLLEQASDQIGTASAMDGRRPRTQFACLVLHADRDATDLLPVLARVMGTEEQFTPARELDPQVGLRATTVAAVKHRE